MKIVRHPFTNNMRKKTNIIVNIMDIIYEWRVLIESNGLLMRVLGILWMRIWFLLIPMNEILRKNLASASDDSEEKSQEAK